LARRDGDVFQGKALGHITVREWDSVVEFPAWAAMCFQFHGGRPCAARHLGSRPRAAIALEETGLVVGRTPGDSVDCEWFVVRP